MTLTNEWQNLGSATLYSSIGIFIDGKLDSQNSSGNYSIARFRFRNGNTAWRTTSGEATFTGSFTDSQSCATYPDNIPIGGTIFEIVKTINHNDDGTKTLYLGGTLYAYINNGRRTANISQVEVVLPKINRQSTWNQSLLSIPNVESSISLPINKYIGEYYNVVEVRNNNNTILVKTINDATNETTITFTSSELNTIYAMDNNPNQLPLRFYMDLITYSDSTKTTQIGTTQRLTCEAGIVNAEPTATYVIEEQDENVISFLGSSTAEYVIANASDLLFTITPSAKKGATISSVKVNGSNATLDGNNYLYRVRDVSTGSYTILITDSRGLTGSYTATKSLLNYVATKINTWSFDRQSPVSSNIVLNADITCFSGTLNSTQNIPTVRYSIDNENWNTIQNYTFNDNKIIISNLTLNNVLPYQQSGILYLEIYDLLTEDKQNDNIKVGIYTFAKSDRKVRINGSLEIADENALNRFEIRKPITYSSNETFVGYWIDNKPIYRKVISSSGLVGENITIAHNISNIKRVIEHSVTAGDNNGNTWLEKNSTFPLSIERIDSTNIIATISNAFDSGWVVYYILYYTKTSD